MYGALQASLHALLAAVRKGLNGHRQIDWLRPDGKSQVSVEYENDRPVAVRTVMDATHLFGSIYNAISSCRRPDCTSPRTVPWPGCCMGTTRRRCFTCASSNTSWNS